jgi:hypothetical protein
VVALSQLFLTDYGDVAVEEDMPHFTPAGASNKEVMERFHIFYGTAVLSSLRK